MPTQIFKNYYKESREECLYLRYLFGLSNLLLTKSLVRVKDYEHLNLYHPPENLY